MSLSIPNVFVGGAGNKAKASEVNGNFNAVAAKFTEGAGGISDGDISATAGIKGSKLSGVAGTRITASQMDDDAVDSRVLKDDINSGSPNAAVKTTLHIADGIITNGKMVDGTLKKGKLNLSSVVVAVGVLTTSATANTDTTLVSTTAFPVKMEVESAGVPGGSHPLMYLVLDTTTNKYWIRARNVNVDLTVTSALSVRVWYLVV